MLCMRAISLNTAMVASALALASSVASPASAAGLDRVPQGVSAADWSSIRAAYEANRHAAFPVERSASAPLACQARNPGQQWRTLFDGRGFVTAPDAGAWSWGLELVSYGRAGATTDPSSARQQAGFLPSCIEADGGRVSYHWDETLTEWYINDSRGLEHGYTVHQRPESLHQRPDGRGGVGAPSRVPATSDADRALTACPWREAKGVAALSFTLAVRGDLTPRVSSDGRSVAFVNDAGAAVVNYSGLTVFDANGATVPARFELPDSNPQFAVRNPQFLRIVVDDADAVYPLTIDPIAQQAYLKASNTDFQDLFGFTVAASGDTVAVGARGEDSDATGVNGDEADNDAFDSGAVYVFVRGANGAWSQQAYIKASNAAMNDEFGYSVALSGDTLVVGAIGEDSSAIGVDGDEADNTASASGAAYVFVRDGGVWTQQAYLKASNTGMDDQFGWSVAVSGDTVVVGAIGEAGSATGVNGNQADDSAAGAGAAYVFVRDANGDWSQQAYLKASNTGADDEFGYSVAASGDTLVVGARAEASSATGVDGNGADDSAGSSGAAYVFFRSGGVWSQQAYLKASNTGADDQFGYSVAASGDTVVVGANREASSATGIDGDGADNGAANAGAAYVFFRDGGVWSQQAYLKASNTDGDDWFGASVAASGDMVVVGARFESSSATGVNGNQADNTANDAGAAYVFLRDGGVWSQESYLKASNSEETDQFGISVAASGDTLVVGAWLEASNATGVNGNQADNTDFASGAAYVFEVDTDGDGVRDGIDGCPIDPAKSDPGACGCGEPEIDTDGDAVPDCIDGCPNDPGKSAPGICGCGVADTDSDGDGTPNCSDGCPGDPNKSLPGVCGCGVADSDSDGDGILNCNDGCPNDPDKTQPGLCGCGVLDVDLDGNGIIDCLESPILLPTEASCCAPGVTPMVGIFTPLVIVGWKLRRRSDRSSVAQPRR